MHMRNVTLHLPTAHLHTTHTHIHNTRTTTQPKTTTQSATQDSYTPCLFQVVLTTMNAGYTLINDFQQHNETMYTMTHPPIYAADNMFACEDDNKHDAMLNEKARGYNSCCCCHRCELLSFWVSNNAIATCNQGSRLLNEGVGVLYI